ncbi:BTB domain-containing protein [Favolaschia claudopus]|uniref:BTB domain-containing protein n=1 Tax=Favolaschia claudopus TaxID=2862362 RepID=A0AAV9ZGC4_9AGAR
MSASIDSDDTASHSSPILVPHRIDDLWFEDGNLVLATQISLFRVYRGLLAKESPVFRDMLRIPQPTDAETLDNCPVVHLPDDDEDVEFFLKALFDYKSFPPPPCPTTFEALRGVARLSKKYEVDLLYKRALAHFATAFPTTLTDYPPSSSWTVGPHHHLLSVLLARELTVEWVLPIAFYGVCRELSVDSVLNGLHVENTRMELCPQDKRVSLEQYTALRGNASSAILEFLWRPDSFKGCLSSAQCKASRVDCRRTAENRRTKDIMPLTLWTDGDWSELTVCERCLKAMKTAHKSALDRLWDSLPERFGLARWDTMEEMKRHASDN